MKRSLVHLAALAVCVAAPRQSQVPLFGCTSYPDPEPWPRLPSGAFWMGVDYGRELRLHPWQEEAVRILSPRVDELVGRRHAVPLRAVTP